MLASVSRSGEDHGRYALPEGPLGLEGPVAKPAPGTLPVRADLAHIALAGTHLAAHYVIPINALVAAAQTSMRCQPRDDAEVNCILARGARLEALDIGGEWVWCCMGPDGPSGYVHNDCLNLGGV
ncbi:MAG: hypothetical protein V2J51_01550 [Erythrobacter sp.]|jgi:hypothetical protein|nr:hypothetical protein [Erythrobacter sp.]